MGTLWYGGTIRPLTAEKEEHQAVYTAHGEIIDVGEEAEVRSRHKGEITREMDLQGGTMYPGFTDSHLHMIGHGEKLLKLDVSDVSSLSRLKEILKRKASEVPEGEWVLAEGFNENLYENQEVPDKFFLDTVTADHPVMLTRVCRHAMVTNSKGLDRAGINKQTQDPEGGWIVRTPEGEPTGYLHDQAQELLKEVLPPIDRGYVKEALQTSLEDLYRNGFTGGHTEDLYYYNDPLETLNIFYEVISGDRKFRTNLLVHHEAAETVLNNKKEHPFVTPGSIKIFTDGALGGRTALLSEPYSDDPSTTGVAIHSQEEVNELTKQARVYGLPIAVHTIGDAALDCAITAIEMHPAPPGKRDRLIHLQITRRDLRERLRKLPVVLDIQPRFVASDFPWVIERLGKKRLPDSFAWKTLLDEGLMCAGGSDAPIEPINPLLGLHAAVTRRKPGESHEGYMPEQKMTLYEALQLFTYGAAQAVGEEHISGLIKPGYRADFTVLNMDLFKTKPDEWLNAKPLMTIVDETVVYQTE
ncbi:amidohydrolase [Alkalicoccus halolimnae]|uniref:Amidohydrolase n=1 Tax=Alkalicoccus halolimnae TaxID=1667239 RepID=A0A5C7FJX3_9BACI|nr:amidohydrolase [Alkalicoccus halolimnae]TXF85716.1 amidohydrolase [Alkalicoccus halolimnae]